MPPTHVTDYPVNYSIALVADVDSSSMGDNFRSITPSSLQDIKTHCERAFVNGALNLEKLRKLTRGPNSKFSGQMNIGVGVIATPAEVLEKVEKALAVYRTEIGTNLTFKAWVPPLFLPDPPPDFRCFRLVYEDGEWKVVYNALLENGPGPGGPPRDPAPLSNLTLRTSQEGDVTLKSHWLATFSYTI